MQSTIVWADIGNTSIKWLCGSAKTDPFEADIDTQIKTTTFHNASDFVAQVTSSQAKLHLSCTPYNRQGITLINQLRDKSSAMTVYQRLEDRFDLLINYECLAEYGIDRYFSNFAILDERSTLVIDWGTAITVDAWQTEQQHQGGWILAGQELYLKAFKALHLSHQPSAQINLAKDTATAIGNGYANLLVNWLNRLPQHSLSMVGFAVQRFVMTGNGYQAYHTQLATDWQMHKHLALKGLIKHSQQTKE